MESFDYREFRAEMQAAGERFFPGIKGMEMVAMSLAGMREMPLPRYGLEQIFRIVELAAFGSAMSIRIIPGEKITLIRATQYVTEQYEVPYEHASKLKEILRSIAECSEPSDEEVGYSDADAFLYESFVEQSHRYFKRSVRKSASSVLPLMQRLWSILLACHPNRLKEN